MTKSGDEFERAMWPVIRKHLGHTDRQTDRLRDRQTDSQTCQRPVLTGRPTDRLTHKEKRNNNNYIKVLLSGNSVPRNTYATMVYI